MKGDGALVWIIERTPRGAERVIQGRTAVTMHARIEFYLRAGPVLGEDDGKPLTAEDCLGAAVALEDMAELLRDQALEMRTPSRR